LVGQEPNVKIYLFQDQVEREKIVNISSAANSEIYSDPSVVRASDRWIRVDWRQVQKFRDGLTIDAFGLPPSRLPSSKSCRCGC
jgi:predicted RNA-binding protein with PUA-like domain